MTLPARILFVCHDGDLYGSQQSLNLIVKHLPKESHLCFVTVARPGPLCKILAAYPYVRVLSHRRLQWVKHDGRSLLHRIGDIFNLLATGIPRTLHLFNTIRRQKINLVHTNSTVSPEGALAAALAGVPHIWHIRELFMEPSPKFHMVLGRRFSRWFIDRFSEQAICISEAVREQFAHYVDQSPERYPVIYNAMERTPETPLLPANDMQRMILRSLSLQTLGIPDNRLPRIGYIGRLSEGKGFHELLEAFILLRERGVQAELAVAGNFVDEPYQKRILDRIAENQLATCVRFLGYCDDLVPVYEILDMLVVPSRNEPFGRVLIEAMAHGVPCIGTDSGGIPEIIETGVTGLLYPPGDIYALSGLIEELMVAFWKQDTLRQNAGRMVHERFTIETQIGMLDLCYQSVLKDYQLY